jgi:hypothetical protein
VREYLIQVSLCDKMAIKMLFSSKMLQDGGKHSTLPLLHTESQSGILEAVVTRMPFKWPPGSVLLSDASFIPIHIQILHIFFKFMF